MKQIHLPHVQAMCGPNDNTLNKGENRTRFPVEFLKWRTGRTFQLWEQLKSCCIRSFGSGANPAANPTRPTPPRRHVLIKSWVPGQQNSGGRAITCPSLNWRQHYNHLPLKSAGPRASIQVTMAVGLHSEGNKANHFSTAHTVSDACKVTGFPLLWHLFIRVTWPFLGF